MHFPTEQHMRHLLDELPAHMSVAVRRGSSQFRRRSLWTTFCAKSLLPTADAAVLLSSHGWQRSLIGSHAVCSCRAMLSQHASLQALSKNAPVRSAEELEWKLEASNMSNVSSCL